MHARFTRRVYSAMALVFFLAAGTVFGQLSPADIEALREQGEREGWTFTVGENDATGRSLEELTGMVEPDKWWVDATFDPCAPTRALPGHFDWRDYGCCTPVRNQGGCGSCWAFATVGALEQNIKIEDGVSVDLSEQWLVSCNRNHWSCGGGWWAHHYHRFSEDACGGTGAVLETDFPYTATDSPCDCPYPHEYFIDGYAYVGSSSDIPSVGALKQAMLDHGPIGVLVTANSAMQAYNGGVFNSCSSDYTNHAVVLVGWDDNQGSDGVWFMRNSWGPGWGEGGYMRIPYGCSNIGYAATYVEYTNLAAPPAQASNWHDTRKNRYISFAPNNDMMVVAFQVEMTEGPGPTGVVGWVGEPEEVAPAEYLSRVVDTPVFRHWTESVIHAGDCEIVPIAVYQIRTTKDQVVFSEPFEIGTILKPIDRYYGDVVGQGLGQLPPAAGFAVPDGVVNISDVQAYCLTAQGSSTPSAHTTWLDLDGLGTGSPPNYILNVSDLQQILLGFKGDTFVGGAGHLYPANCP